MGLIARRASAGQGGPVHGAGVLPAERPVDVGGGRVERRDRVAQLRAAVDGGPHQRPADAASPLLGGDGHRRDAAHGDRPAVPPLGEVGDPAGRDQPGAVDDPEVSPLFEHRDDQPAPGLQIPSRDGPEGALAVVQHRVEVVGGQIT